VRHLGDAGHPARQWKHCGNFTEGQRQKQHGKCANDPGNDGRGAGQLCGQQRSKQPSGADDSADAQRHQPNRPDFPFEFRFAQMPHPSPFRIESTMPVLLPVAYCGKAEAAVPTSKWDALL